MKAALTVHLFNIYILTNILLIVRKIELVKIDIKTMIKPKKVGKTTERDKDREIRDMWVRYDFNYAKYFENDSLFCLILYSEVYTKGEV